MCFLSLGARQARQCTWFKTNGSYDIKEVREKEEELESNSSHKSDIWSPAAYKKLDEMCGEYFSQI